MRLGYRVALMAIFFVWAGAAWGEEAISSPKQIEALPAKTTPETQPAPEAPPAPVPALTLAEREKRETIWSSILKIARSKGASKATLLNLLSRYLDTFQAPDDPHRAAARHLLTQLREGLEPGELALTPPKPPLPPLAESTDYLSVRLHCGGFVRGKLDFFGGQIGIFGFRNGHFTTDLFYVSGFLPAENSGLFVLFGTAFGGRLPLDAGERHELRFLGGAALSLVASRQMGFVSLALPLEASYVYRLREHFGVQVGIQASLDVIALAGNALITGFVGLRF